MSRIDESRPFIPVNIAVLTVSDTRTEKTDKSGNLLASMIAEAGHHLAARAIVTDDVKAVRKQVKEWIKDPEVDVVITTGAGSTEAALREGDRRLLSAVPSVELPERRHLDGAIARLRRVRRRHADILRPRLARRLPGRLARHPQGSARQSPPAMQFPRNHAPLPEARGGRGHGLGGLRRCQCCRYRR